METLNMTPPRDKETAADPPPIDDALVALISSKLYARATSLHALFVRCDYHRTGRITPRDLRFALDQQLGIALSPSELRALVMRFDDRGDGRFAYDEFVAWMSARTVAWSTTSRAASAAVGRDVHASDGRSAPPPEMAARARSRLRAAVARKLRRKASSARELFLSLDTSRSGRVDASEIRAGLARLGVALSAAEASEIVADFDAELTGEARTLPP
jgi:Ca2+-binding EF-hand superfamily protein